MNNKGVILLSIASALIIAALFYALFFQPASKVCKPATIIEMATILNAEHKFYYSIKADDGVIVHSNSDADFYYSHTVGDQVKICEHTGRWIPIMSYTSVEQ